MSNKKRISKKIQKIESKKISSFKNRLHLACVSSYELTGALERLNNIFFEGILKMNNFQDKIVRICSEKIKMDGETLDFVHKVWKLSGVDDMESKRILAEMPEETRDPLLNLLIVGYELSEAYDLIKETFKY